MISTDYSMRQVDLESLQTVSDPRGVVAVVIDNVGNNVARAVTGIQKAVQRYAQLLLTAVGDVRFADDRGSVLASALSTGTVGNIGYLTHLFVVSSIAALDSMTTDDANTDKFGTLPDDERIISAELTDVVLQHDSAGAAFSVRLTTFAGESYSYVIPVTTIQG